MDLMERLFRVACETLAEIHAIEAALDVNTAREADLLAKLSKKPTPKTWSEYYANRSERASLDLKASDAERRERAMMAQMDAATCARYDNHRGRMLVERFGQLYTNHAPALHPDQEVKP